MRKKAEYSVYRRGPYFTASYYDPNTGRRVIRSTFETDETKARAVALAYAKGTVIPRQVPKVTGTLREYSAPFFTESCPRARRMREAGWKPSARWQRMQRSWLTEHILTDEIADMRLADISRGAILDFRGRILSRLPDQRNTVNKVIAVLGTILSEAAFREDIKANPSARVGSVKEDRKEAGTFTAAELSAMFPGEGLGPWKDIEDYTCFCLAAETGMRRGELLGLKWGAIDFDAALITVELAWKGTRGKVREYGPPKSGKSRTFPLPAFSAVKLAELRDREGPSSEFVFSDADGNPRGETWLRKHFLSAMKSMKIDARARRLSPHSYRHTLNSLLLASGADPMLVRAALGWSGARIQETYLHLSANDLRSVTTKIGELIEHKTP